MSLRAEFLPSARSAAIGIVTNYLRQSRTLQPVKTWFLWAGDHKHDARDIVFTDMPALRITADIGGETAWIDEMSHKTAIRFKHELWIKGTRLTDFIDFWSAVELAWFDQTNQLFVQLMANNNALRIWQKTITAPAPAPQFFGGEMGMYGVGTITLYLDITTGE
jgi:hypothetical protein